jgi:histidinol phosphatase-like PHP family hydrolase
MMEKAEGKTKTEKKPEKKKQQLSAQLEDKWVGSRSEAFTRIVAKETEIRSKTGEEKRKSERMIEDAKGKAATIKREALMEEIGKDEYRQEIDNAKKEIEDIKLAAGKEAERVREEGLKNLDKALDFIIGSITTSTVTGS